jgi:hypothetical protein
VQSAYSTFHSCETSVIRVVNDLLKSVDEGMGSLLLFLDLSAAFDTVDHAILIQRLMQMVVVYWEGHWTGSSRT